MSFKSVLLLLIMITFSGFVVQDVYADGEKKKVKFANITFDPDTKRMEVDAKFCLKKGILEWLLVLNDTKEHEAVFALKCIPQELNLCLIMMGLEAKQPPVKPKKWKDLEKDENYHKSMVDIVVEWEFNGKKHSVPVEDLLIDRNTQKPSTKLNWVFTGSKIFEKDGKKQFLANYAGLIVTIWPDDSAIIQLGKDVANPYHGEDLGYEVNSKLVPPEGTDVKLIFTPAKAPVKTPEKK